MISIELKEATLSFFLEFDLELYMLFFDFGGGINVFLWVAEYGR
jgi:hypothetical protein